MRKVLWTVLILGAVACVLVSGAYGWDTAVETKDKVVTAFFLGMVVVLNFVLHFAAIRAWLSGARKRAVFIGVAAFLAFAMTAYGSFGGLAVRADRVVAERQDALDNRDDIKRQINDLARERDGLEFKRTMPEGVKAAQLAADAAKLAKDRECGNGDPAQRGKLCRQKEVDEAVAIRTLTDAQQNRASTARFDEIEASLKELRSRKSEGSVGAADPVRELLAAILGAWADRLTAWQKVVLALVFDVCLIAVVVAIDAIPGHRRRDEPKTNVAPTKTPAPVASPEPIIIERPRPRLAVANRQPVGSVLDFVREGVTVAAGQETGVISAFKSYQRWCQSKDCSSLEIEDFAQELWAICNKAGIPTRGEGSTRSVVNVRLAPPVGASGSA